MRYVVTGTAGFIGFHLTRRLLEDGDKVAGFNRMTPDNRIREPIEEPYRLERRRSGRLPSAQALRVAGNAPTP